MLCPTAYDEFDQASLFKPLVDVVPVLQDVRNLLDSILKMNPGSTLQDAVCVTKSPDDTTYGGGAVWTAKIQKYIRSKHGGRYVQSALDYTILSNTGTQIKFLQEITTTENGCAKTLYPVTVTITAQENGADSLVTTQIEGTIPALHESCPKVLLFCPCFWPHCLIAYTMGVLCQPCCYLCCIPNQKTAVQAQCNVVNCQVKNLVENGPEPQAMTDAAPLLAQLQMQQMQMQQMQMQMAQGQVVPMQQQAPPGYQSASAAPTPAPPGSVNLQTASFGFCSKCGNAKPEADAAFCSKCAHPF